MSQGLTFPNRVSSTDASRAWTLGSTCHSQFLSHRSWDVSWFSKQSAITLAFSFRWYLIPKGPWTVVGVFGPYLFICDFIISNKAWSGTSQFPTFFLIFKECTLLCISTIYEIYFPVKYNNIPINSHFTVHNWVYWSYNAVVAAQQTKNLCLI
jgi:hypothetical protein